MFSFLRSLSLFLRRSHPCSSFCLLSCIVAFLFPPRFVLLLFLDKNFPEFLQSSESFRVSFSQKNGVGNCNLFSSNAFINAHTLLDGKWGAKWKFHVMGLTPRGVGSAEWMNAQQLWQTTFSSPKPNSVYNFRNLYLTWEHFPSSIPKSCP